MLVSAKDTDLLSKDSFKENKICMLQKPRLQADKVRTSKLNCCLANCTDKTNIAIPLSQVVEFLQVDRTTKIPNSISYCQFFMKWRKHWIPIFQFDERNNFSGKIAKNALVVKFKGNNKETIYLAIACQSIETTLASDSNFCIPDNWHELSFRESIRSAFQLQNDGNNMGNNMGNNLSNSTGNNTGSNAPIAYILDLATLYLEPPNETLI